MENFKEIGLEKLEQTFSLPDVVSLCEEEDSLVILDQTQLPAQEVFLKIDNEEELIDAIVRLKVRGAPAIGVAAAAGLYVCFARVCLFCPHLGEYYLCPTYADRIPGSGQPDSCQSPDSRQSFVGT